MKYEPSATATALAEAQAELKRMRKKVRDLERDQFRCIGWITREAYDRLSNGGNGSRGTVPIHSNLVGIIVGLALPQTPLKVLLLKG